jgi:hypothetical protein
MKAKVLTGSKSEIAAAVVRIDGVIHEVIAFIEEPSNSIAEPPTQDIFPEMEPFTVKAGGADYSRQSAYTRMEGEGLEVSDFSLGLA